MSARTQITLDPDMRRRAHAKAAELGISFAEYVRRLVAGDLGDRKAKAGISAIFNLVDEGPPTNIARDKHKMIADAVWDTYLTKMGRKPKRQGQAKAGSR